MAVTPKAGLVSQITTGGDAVTVSNGGDNGGIVTNPLSATDQGLVTAETLYIDPVGSAGLQASGTTFALAPGQSWTFIEGQTTPTSVNAVSDGHKFSVVRF